METTSQTGFGNLIVAVFCPPLYFFLRGKVGLGIVHSVLYLFAILFLIFGVGMFFWFIGFAHAYWDFAHAKRNEHIERQATAIAEKMAAKRSGVEGA